MRIRLTKSSSAECKYVCLDAGCEEGDHERTVGDRSRLANQLIEPLLGYASAALFVGVEAVRIAGTFTVDQYPEHHRSTLRTRSHDEVDVAGVEAEEDSAAGAVEHDRPTFDRPIPFESPMVQIQPVGRDVGVGLVEDCTVVRCEASCLLVAEVGLGRLRLAQSA